MCDHHAMTSVVIICELMCDHHVMSSVVNICELMYDHHAVTDVEFICVCEGLYSRLYDLMPCVSTSMKMYALHRITTCCHHL